MTVLMLDLLALFAPVTLLLLAGWMVLSHKLLRLRGAPVLVGPIAWISFFWDDFIRADGRLAGWPASVFFLAQDRALIAGGWLLFLIMSSGALRAAQARLGASA